jgi:hypothetical protein
MLRPREIGFAFHPSTIVPTYGAGGINLRLTFVILLIIPSPGFIGAKRIEHEVKR